jgi:5-formyltetrahydrofolate cyclo-ligase
MTSIQQTRSRQTHAAKKAELRQTCLNRRDQAARQAGTDAAQNALRHFLADVAISPQAVISAYWPMRGELDPVPLITELVGRGHACALPVITGRDAALEFRSWQPGDDLDSGPFGTREPRSGARVLVPDVLIVPLVAFDRHGHRLGYGGGYYDRTLAALRKASDVMAVGYAYAGQEMDELPQDPFDQGLDWLVTEQAARVVG